jgi:AcrR family transcriptional regulator
VPRPQVPPLEGLISLEPAAHASDASGASVDGVDGRKVRGMRNRDAVVDAILSLLDEGDHTPSAAEVAERAGVSLRSVFRYFDDLDSLFLAGIQRQAERTAHLYRPPRGTGSVADRVAALVAQRRKLFEAVAPVRRTWVRRFDNHPAVVPVMANLLHGLRQQVETLFQAELATLPKAQAREVVDAIDAATSFQTWDFLRFEQHYPVNRATASVRRTIVAVLRDAGITL